MKVIKNMDTISTEPVEQSEIQNGQRALLLETAIGIQLYRLASLTPGASLKTMLRKINTLNGLERDITNPQNNEITAQQGCIHEALFYAMTRQLEIPISVSTDKEDMQGIDFHLGSKLIDVTINPTIQILQEKIKRSRAIVLRLPTIMVQETATQNNPDTILNAFLENRLTPQEYIEQVIIINRDFEKILVEKKNSTNSELSNEKITKQLHNLQHTLGYLSRFLEKL